ncbi:MAG: hypothetical protein ACRECH_01520 [Nitrososphaerales archaeon]
MRPAHDDSNEFLNRIAPYIESEGGRNLNRIARELSIPYPTVRFRMLKLKQQGVNVTPAIDVEKLGLERVRVSFYLSREVTNYKAFFGGLFQAAGLHYYGRSLISQVFDCEFMVPRYSIAELAKLLNALEEMKIVSGVVIRRLVWKEVLMMKTEFYDYEHNEWDVDFSQLVGNPSVRIPIPSEPEKIDQYDLLIVKSLQIDPWANAVDIAKELGITDSDVSYHLKKHVFGRKLVPGFRLKWVGMKSVWAKHTIVPFTLIFPELSDEALRHAMSVVTSVPFTWNHMRADDGTYMTELLVPAVQLPETFRYLSDNLREIGLMPQFLHVDWLCLSTYTIPYSMHDRQNGWSMNAERSLGYVLQMIKTYQE